MMSVASALLACALLSGTLSQEGGASFYGNEFHGRRTASGERFSNAALTAAHRTLPFGTWVRVTRLDTGDTVIVRINDRGPFIRGRIIDLSRRAAEDIRMISRGVARVRVDVIPVPVSELPALVADVTHLVGELPAPGETLAVRHGTLPIGLEGLAALATGGYGDTVLVPFRVVGRARRAPHEFESAEGGRGRRAVRIASVSSTGLGVSGDTAAPSFPSEGLPVSDPLPMPVPSGVEEPLFPTPVLPAAPTVESENASTSVAYPS